MDIVLELPTRKRVAEVLQIKYNISGRRGSYCEFQKELVEKVELYRIWKGRKLIGGLEYHYMTQRGNKKGLNRKRVTNEVRELCSDVTRSEFVFRADLENFERACSPENYPSEVISWESFNVE